MDDRTAGNVRGLGEGIVIALDALWSSKLRSFLTVLGTIIAVTAIILVVTVVEGLNSEVTAALTSEGADVFTVDREGIVTSHEEWEAVRHRPLLTRQDAMALRQDGRTFAALMEAANARAEVDDRTTTVQRARVLGRSHEYSMIDNSELAAGRYFSALEVDRNRAVVLLGQDVFSELFAGQSASAALQHRVRIQGLHFTVIGVLKSRGAIFGFSQDDYVVIPIGAFQRLFGTRSSLDFIIKPHTLELTATAMDEARLLMRIRHRLPSRRPGRFRHWRLHDLSRPLSSGHGRNLQRARGCRGHGLGGRRHRHHEHHADGGDRAHPGDRSS